MTDLFKAEPILNSFPRDGDAHQYANMRAAVRIAAEAKQPLQRYDSAWSDERISASYHGRATFNEWYYSWADRMAALARTIQTGRDVDGKAREEGDRMAEFYGKGLTSGAIPHLPFFSFTRNGWDSDGNPVDKPDAYEISTAYPNILKMWHALQKAMASR